jgi:hypothetical protein
MKKNPREILLDLSKHNLCLQSYTKTTIAKEVTLMASGQRSNQLVVPQARKAMDQLKFETAAEIGLTNYEGYLGDVPSRLNGAVGGNMVRKMIQAYQQSRAGQ